jgi:hypothetical protein
VLFVARYAWPTQATVKKLQRLTKDFVWNVSGTQARRPWIGEQQAELPLTGGEIAMPNITTELLTLSANVVARWAANATALERLLDDIHLGAQLAPSIHHSGTPLSNHQAYHWRILVDHWSYDGRTRTSL